MLYNSYSYSDSSFFPSGPEGMKPLTLKALTLKRVNQHSDSDSNSV